MLRYRDCNVVAILGGLGSQMLKYAFFLDVKANSSKKTYFDISPFEYMKMWNGYELERVFHIDNTADLWEQGKAFKTDASKGYSWNALKELVKYDTAFCLSRGIPYRFIESDTVMKKILDVISHSLWNARFKMSRNDKYPDGYYNIRGNVYFDEFDHQSDRYFSSSKSLIRKTFTFDSLCDDSNINISQKMKRKNSVALHIRRSDHMYDNGSLFDNGFFYKSVQYIKKHCESPSFFIFSDDIEWCRINHRSLGLETTDEYYFVDWNKGDKSYIDMQLMTLCQHNVVPISSFSWWGCYLSKRSDKLSFAPKGYWHDLKIHY